MDRFAQILYDLGQELEIELFPDANRICQLNYKDNLHIQIHYDEPKEQIMIGTFLCDVPPGKYREKLLAATLASNHEYPRRGIFAYSERNNQLTFFTYAPTKGIRSDELSKQLNQFIETALLWKEAVENGKPLPTTPKTGGEGSIFDLKP